MLMRCQSNSYKIPYDMLFAPEPVHFFYLPYIFALAVPGSLFWNESRKQINNPKNTKS